MTLARVADAETARALTDRIKVAVEAVWELVKTAYVSRAYTALGYANWDDYCTREFGTARLRIPREERPEVVSSLRESGMSIRAIESATGLGHGTVRRALSGAPNGAPAEPEPADDTGPKERLTTKDLLGYYVLSWNAYRERRSISKLQRPKESKGHYWTADNFPEPK